MIYYNSRELSNSLGVNLAKWKRWVREFLPPDPLGGLQSGYARQFNLKEAFRVFLGGYLVSALKFSIPEARQILTDLDAWLGAEGFYALQPHNHVMSCHGGQSLRIFILQGGDQKLSYIIQRAGGSEDVENSKKVGDHYEQTLKSTSADSLWTGTIFSGRVLFITALYFNSFLKSILHT